MSYHYKKDGSLDMRYSSSKAAASSGYSGGSSSRASGNASYSGGNYGYGSSSSSSGLNYKKDGSLDMRYSSSKAAVGSGYSGGNSSYAAPSNSSDLNYKKDGSLDMRFASSKAASYSESRQDVHLKKDGTPDMRFSSSKALLLGQRFGEMKVSESRKGIPAGIPLTRNGLPDMRTRAAKEWVEQAASCSNALPAWLPKKKDGNIDASKAVVAAFLQRQKQLSNGPAFDFDHDCRARYYEERMRDEDDLFKNYVQQERRKLIEMPETDLLPGTQNLRRELTAPEATTQISSEIPLLSYNELKESFGKEENVVGKGSFGEVIKGKYRGQDVAVKRMHLKQLTKKETQSFVNEMNILAKLGRHVNLVKLIGYTLEPPCIVMEFVELGSLEQILHYCKDPKIEAKITTGNNKKRVLLGIVDGMRQVHAVGIVHGDLKPANILLLNDFTAKIADFGLAKLRGKTSSSIASINDGENIVGGTGAYMAPELLNSSSCPEFSCDVYSFGVLLNEVIQEEQPFEDQVQNFHGRGAFGAANHARLGNRPFINSKTPISLQALIKKCWDKVPEIRPTFDRILPALRDLDIPNSF